MEYKRLGDIATYINGYAFSPEQRGETGLPIIRIQDLTGNSYDLGYYDGEYPSKIEINNGDVLISWSASLGVYVWEIGKALLNQHIFKVVFDKCQVDKRFFVYQVKSILEKYSSQAHGATMKHLTKPVFDALPFYYPPIAEQRRIAAVLDKAAALIDLRKQQLAKLDELVKARFVEMFGDVKTNKYGWKKCLFGDITTKITDGEHGTVPRAEKADGRLYFMARNITKVGEIDLSESSYVPEEVHQKIYKRCNPEPNDILLVCVGATIGKSTLVPEYLGEFSMARSVALLKPDNEKVNSTFLISLLKSDAIQNDIAHCAHAAAQAGLYTNMIKSLDAYLPPMELQAQFAAFAKQLDKSKAAIQKSLDEAQLLFDSLMQKYFG